MAHLDFETPLVELEARIGALKAASGHRAHDIAEQIEQLETRAEELRRSIYDDLTIWQKVQLSRHPERPYFLDYLGKLFDDFLELHGDRTFADDPAIVSGFARFDGETVAVIGHQKGRTTKQKVERNFGMAHPEGYRKAIRIMKLADRFHRPVLTFIDTPGAYPGVGAEERGQGEAIGQSLLTMSQLSVPVIATVLGEGGSGGALAMGVANRVLMLEYATYTVITPEGCASILWRDAARAHDAAEQLHLLADDAYALDLVDEVVSEPMGGAHRHPADSADRLGESLRRALAELTERAPAELLEGRYERFRAIGRLRAGGTSR